MLRKILFISLALLLSCSAIKFTIFSNPALAAPATFDETTREQILGATVYITLYAPLTDEQGDPQYVMENGQQVMQYTGREGLGTVAHQGEDVVIVTHDHWMLLTPELRRVRFHNVAHELLLDVSGEQFFQLIRYRDGGTMVLSAPDALVGIPPPLSHEGLLPVLLGSSNSAGPNDIVTLAYRQPYDDQIGVASMLVQRETSFKGKPVFRLTSLNGEVVVEGNSGGGVLFNGKLIGNMWGTILVDKISRISGRHVNSSQQTSYSLAAQLPAEILAQ